VPCVKPHPATVKVEITAASRTIASILHVLSRLLQSSFGAGPSGTSRRPEPPRLVV
jgi:hypothetical protein